MIFGVEIIKIIQICISLGLKYWIIHTVLLANLKRPRTEPNFCELKVNPHRTKSESESRTKGDSEQKGFLLHIGVFCEVFRFLANY